jgi:hypothetical protein
LPRPLVRRFAVGHRRQYVRGEPERADLAFDQEAVLAIVGICTREWGNGDAVFQPLLIEELRRLDLPFEIVPEIIEQ